LFELFSETRATADLAARTGIKKIANSYLTTLILIFKNFDLFKLRRAIAEQTG